MYLNNNSLVSKPQVSTPVILKAIIGHDSEPVLFTSDPHNLPHNDTFIMSSFSVFHMKIFKNFSPQNSGSVRRCTVSQLIHFIHPSYVHILIFPFKHAVFKHLSLYGLPSTTMQSADGIKTQRIKIRLMLRYSSISAVDRASLNNL